MRTGHRALLSLALGFAFCLAPGLRADEAGKPLKQQIKDDWHETKAGVKATGKQIKQSSKKAWLGAKSTGKQAGKDMANPTAEILSATLMLRHLGENEAADKVKYAIHAVYREGKHTTRDMGGTASTSEFADAVIAAMETPAAKAVE